MPVDRRERAYGMKAFAQSLRGQLILLIIAALAAAQLVSLWLFVDERSMAVHMALGLETAGRAANIARLIEEAPPEMHDAILRAASSPLVRFSLTDTPAVDHTGHSAGGTVENTIRRILPGYENRPIRVELHEFSPDMLPVEGVPSTMAEMHMAMMRDHVSAIEMQLSIALTTDQWLNVDTRFHNPPLQWPLQSFVSFGFTATLILGAAIWFLLTRLTGPLRRLSLAADQFGRGEDVQELTVSGPTEVRDLTQAFNHMRDRLTRYVADRTRLLGALGHDLRSPLTGLRVRAELVEEEETRDHLIETIEEMQDMVDSTLSFAKGVATREPSSTVPIGEFVTKTTEDIVQAGNVVEVSVADNPAVTLRPMLMKRALRNIIENACRYGARADVSVKQEGNEAKILIQDQGPGIPEHMLDAVFDPFVRLETSRSRETGGTGLGLSIARTIIQSHGGTIELLNRETGGLCAKVVLPVFEGQT
ncbi:ATP-binding protein [Ruegeria arenilitoris]|uniref:ATP-binding protein n=2 Tax=Ruegeria TaxID=97050 RepID=UPI0020C2B004|nr:ATP-binding protein [Ruegeria arenilitoris]